jgi:hypothetical protein
VASASGTAAGPERGAYEVGRRGARRRPSGEAPPLPKAPWWPRIAAVLVVVILLGFVMLALFGSDPPAGVLAWFARFQHEPVVSVAKVLNWFASKTGIIVLRIAMAIVLVSFLRFRHLFVAIVAIGVMDLLATSSSLRFELNPPGARCSSPPRAGTGTSPPRRSRRSRSPSG